MGFHLLKNFLSGNAKSLMYSFSIFSLINESAFSRTGKIVSVLIDADASTVIVFKALSDLTKY